MNIICKYTDNQHLIEREDENNDEVEYETSPELETVSNLRLRCQIL
jgi:hypothetical protein